MGGTITVRSHPGAGSCFQFEIGLKPQVSSAPHRVAPDEVQGCRILVVDDSEQARTWLGDQLAALRFHVHCVDSGEAALSVLRTQRFDVILMDWMMPGIDGIETTRRIKSDLGLAAIPAMIMVTAHGREAIKDAAESVGIRRFLIKPVDASVLLDTILDVLGADIMRTKSQPETGQAQRNARGRARAARRRQSDQPATRDRNARQRRHRDGYRRQRRASRATRAGMLIRRDPDGYRDAGNGRLYRRAPVARAVAAMDHPSSR